MSLAISVTDHATPLLTRLALQMKAGKAMHQSVADGVRVTVQEHFRNLASSNRNRLGGRSTRFWSRMRSQVVARATDTEATVAMPREVAQRFFGGTITPVNAKYLTIPASGEAHGRRAREFNDLRFVPTRSGGMLVKREATGIRIGKNGKVSRGREQGGEVMYFLVRSVTQRGDSSVLPSDGELQKAAFSQAEVYLTRVTRRNS